MLILLLMCNPVFSQGLSAQDTLTQDKEFRLEVTKGEGVLLYLTVTNTGSEEFEIPPLLTAKNFVRITHPNGRQSQGWFTQCLNGNSVNTDVLATGDSHTYELDLKMMMFGYRPRKAEDIAAFGFEWIFYNQTTEGIGLQF